MAKITTVQMHKKGELVALQVWEQ